MLGNKERRHSRVKDLAAAKSSTRAHSDSSRWTPRRRGGHLQERRLEAHHLPVTIRGHQQGDGRNWLVGNEREDRPGPPERGVRFEDYDLPGMTRRATCTWRLQGRRFKDPDGNILALMNT